MAIQQKMKAWETLQRYKFSPSLGSFYRRNTRNQAKEGSSISGAKKRNVILHLYGQLCIGQIITFVSMFWGHPNDTTVASLAEMT